MNLIQRAFADIFTFTRASGGGRINSSGVYEWVAANQPRFDYDPVTLQPKGILIEEQRTNLISASGNLSDAGWYVSGSASKTGNTITIAGDYNSRCFWGQSGLTVGGSYTGSMLLSGPAGAQVSLVLQEQGGSYSETSKTITLGATPQWFSITRSNIQYSTIAFLVRARGDSCTMSFGGSQLEAGAFPTSYIPTSGSQVTRAVDIPTEQLQPWFKPGVGTVVWRGDVSAVPAGKWQGLFQFDDGSTANRLGAYVYPNGTLGLDRRIAGAMVNIATANSVTPGAQFKVACSWDSVNFYLSLNGGPVVSAAHGGLPTVNRLVHGKFDDYLNGHEAGFKYLPKTTIGAALQALSA